MSIFISEPSDDEDTLDTNIDSLQQSGSGEKRNQFIPDVNDDDFISKVALLVHGKLNNPLSSARPTTNSWTNFDLSPPSTSVIDSANTDPPLPYNNNLQKNDENDIYGNCFSLTVKMQFKN